MSFTTESLIPRSPAIPPAPPPSPVQKSQPLPNTTMQLTYLKEFEGEPDRTLQGPTFIMQFSRAMDELQITMDCEHIRRIGNYLSPDSPAEEWYTSASSTNTSWKGEENIGRVAEGNARTRVESG
ncbi:hypothetical protein L208DRAFT_1377015 [Tricholoma matsutake]|nr:hypothetical protein L208DRAFT_1377015 [Tricholoma matsutake 945]